MRTPRWVPLVYLGPAVAVMAVACLVPLLSALQLGFYDWSMGTPWGEAKWVGLDAFIAAFKDGAVWRSLLTTLMFAAVCVVADRLVTANSDGAPAVVSSMMEMKPASVTLVTLARIRLVC